MIGVYDYTVILTYLSFISGLIGIYFAFDGNMLISIICLMLSGFFDMFDGKVARTKKNRTDIGKKFGIQIDSLADLVAFCVLPSAIGVGLGVNNTYLSFALILLPLCGLIRLAYFNVSEEERSSKTEEVRKEYLGLPVTTTAIILPIIYIFKNALGIYFSYLYGIILLLISILFITKFSMIKLKTKGMIFMSIFGLCVVLLLIFMYI